MALTSAYRKDTGEKVHVPEHWIGDPHVGAPFEKTPSQRARDARRSAGDEPDGPDDSWTVQRLRDHAAEHGVDLAGATTKAEILTALSTPPAGE